MTNYVQILRDNTTVLVGKGKKKKPLVKQSGDWVQVDMHEARRLVANNQAALRNTPLPFDSQGIQVFWMHPSDTPLVLPFDNVTVGMGYPPTIEGNDDKLFLVLGDSKPVELLQNPAKFALFFELLQSVDVLLVLHSFNITVHDTHMYSDTPTLHLPYFKDCIFGVNNTKGGQAFYEEWFKNKEFNPFALTEALHATTPTVNFLPPDWGE